MEAFRTHRGERVGSLRSWRVMLVIATAVVASLMVVQPALSRSDRRAAGSSQRSSVHWMEVRSPSARQLVTQMAYDEARDRILMFGGQRGGPQFTFLNDTWSWDGSGWTQLHPGTTPPARVNGMMAYDAATQLMILFGGQNTAGILADTWSWDGTTWTKRSPSVAPSARVHSAIASDPLTGHILLFGGFDSVGQDLADTWTWDGTTWVKLTPSSTPSPRDSGAMAYDGD